MFFCFNYFLVESKSFCISALSASISLVAFLALPPPLLLPELLAEPLEPLAELLELLAALEDSSGSSSGSGCATGSGWTGAASTTGSG